jgi:hypothetical protein
MSANQVSREQDAVDALVGVAGLGNASQYTTTMQTEDEETQSQLHDIITLDLVSSDPVSFRGRWYERDSLKEYKRMQVATLHTQSYLRGVDEFGVNVRVDNVEQYCKDPYTGVLVPFADLVNAINSPRLPAAQIQQFQTSVERYNNREELRDSFYQQRSLNRCVVHHSFCCCRVLFHCYSQV